MNELSDVRKTDTSAGRRERDPTMLVSAAIEDLRRGRPVVVADGHEQYGYADLTMAAELVTPSDTNFMATHGGGIIYVCLTEDRCRELGLPPMRAGGDPARRESAITVSIEAREGVTTGSSAADRARTVRVAADPTKGHRDIAAPGHIFPVCARRGGVLGHAGRAEASVDLVRLAGFFPAGANCELLTRGGEAARGDDLLRLAREHELCLITVGDLVAFRRLFDRREVTFAL